MQLIKFTLLAVPFLTVVSAVAVADTATSFALKTKSDADAVEAVKRGLPVVERQFEEGQLEERTNCPGATDNGCKCAKGSKQGQYCGYCDQVISKGSATYWGENSFECSPSGSCCFYGVTKKCESSSWSDWCPR